MPTIDERCWDGYEPVPGKEPYSDDSCRPEKGKGKGKAEGDGVPDKVKEIADAIKRDNPGISDEKKMRIAWSTYKKMGKGKDAAGMGSGYGSPSDIGVTGMIPYPAEQTCSSLIERLQEERNMLGEKAEEIITEAETSSPPQGARNNAKKVLKWKEEHGNEVKAMTQTGWTRANQLASGENLSLETVKRMAAFERHRQNATVSPEHKGEPWKDNGHVAWLGWGGDAGVRWAKGIVNSLKENGQLSEDLAPSRNDLGFYNDIIDFFGRNPYPFDWQVHQFAAEMGVDRETMEFWIYRLLTDLLGNGGYIDFARGTQEG